MATKLPGDGNQKWVRNSGLAKHFNVSAMTLWRWKRDPSLNCPPSYEVNDTEWHDLDAWDAWMKARIVNYLKTKSKPSQVERLHKKKASR